MTRTRTTPTDLATARAFAIEAARLAADLKCDDLAVFDVHGLSQVCDFIVVASGTSERQMRSVAMQLEALGKEQGHAVFRNSADRGATWIVVDFVDVVVHLFEPDQRHYYDLESLWADAPRVAWEREGDERRRGGRVR